MSPALSDVQSRRRCCPLRHRGRPETVHKWLVAAGVPRRPSAVAPRGDFDDNEIKWLYCDEHRSGAEISKLLGCSAGLVYFRLARLGIDPWRLEHGR